MRMLGTAYDVPYFPVTVLGRIACIPQMCHHHRHHVRLLEVVKRNQTQSNAQYNSLLVD